MKKIANPEMHFWSRVNILRGNLCWEWTGPLNNWGYGRAKLSTIKTQIASRVAWILTSGVTPPKGVLVCHKCDNPKCCRPDHLFLGTPSDNSQDRENKSRGRDVKGRNHHHAKLTNENVRDILKMRSEGLFLREIAEKFKVTIATISYVTTGKTWTHIKEVENAIS